MKRVLLWSVCGVVFLGALGHILFYEHAKDVKRRALRRELMAIAAKSAPSIDAAALARIPLTMDGDKSPEYKDIFDTLLQIKETYPIVKYVYILTDTNEPGILQFVVDADPLPAIITAKSQRSFPGDKYDARSYPEMLNGFRGPSADRKISADDWGVTLSGYAPIKDTGGKVVAILCIDMDAGQLYAYLQSVRPIIFLLWVLVAAAIIAFMVDLALRKRIVPGGSSQKP